MQWFRNTQDVGWKEIRPHAWGGHSGEGVSVRDASSSIRVPAKHFMEDATFDTIQKAENMVDETANKIIR